MEIASRLSLALLFSVSSGRLVVCLPFAAGAEGHIQQKRWKNSSCPECKTNGNDIKMSVLCFKFIYISIFCQLAKNCAFCCARTTSKRLKRQFSTFRINHEREKTFFLLPHSQTKCVFSDGMRRLTMISQGYCAMPITRKFLRSLFMMSFTCYETFYILMVLLLCLRLFERAQKQFIMRLKHHLVLS